MFDIYLLISYITLEPPFPQFPTKVRFRLDRPLKSIVYNSFIIPEPRVSVRDYALKEIFPMLPLHQILLGRIPAPQHL
jgi:hypothetical protein